MHQPRVSRFGSRYMTILQYSFFACLFVFVGLLTAIVVRLRIINIRDYILLTALIIAGAGLIGIILVLRRFLLDQNKILASHDDHLMQMERIGGFAHWEFDFDENRMDLCENAYALLDFPVGYLEDADIFISHVHPEDREMVRSRFRERKDTQYTMEYRIINPSAEIIWVEVFSESRLDSHGTIDGRLGIMRDITSFRVREEALQTAVQKTEKALQMAEMFEWEYDLETRRFGIMEPYGAKLFLQPGRFSFTLEEFFSRVDQEHRENALRLMTTRDSEDDAALELELRFNRVDGEIYYLRMYGTPVRDSQGWVVKRFGIAQDISTLRETEHALEESEREKNLVIDNINLGLALWTPDRRLIWANRVLLNLFRAEHHDLKRDELCYQLLKTDNHPCSNCPIPDALHQRQSVTQEIAVAGRILSVTAVPFIDRYGEVTRIITIVNDVSGQKAFHDQLLQIQKMDAVGQLAAGIAHDFNNLLHVMLNYIESALDTCDERTRTSLEPIAEAAKKGHDLVSQLMTFSRTESNFQPQAVNPGDFLPQFVVRIRPFLRETISVELSIDSKVSEISADPGLLEQILENLVKNAEDAMPEGGLLTISARDADMTDLTRMNNQGMRPESYVTITVSDTGVGIPESEIPEIFNPFYSTKDVGEGKGLGLSTVYALMKKHQGFIEVKSEKNVLTEFILFFPVRHELDVDTDELMRSIRQSIASEAITILLVDDDPTVRKVTVHTLEKAGYVLLEAADGQTAIDLFSKHADSIQLVLLDVVLPRRSGREVFDHIQAIRPGTRVIFATGYASTYLDDLPQDAPVIHKPYAKSALLRTIKVVFAPQNTYPTDKKNEPVQPDDEPNES
ncbi:PAS domain-containing protein [bacterium]|nr:PAS domain-containing protein [candidate division CSSED10-310 bacterium]